MDTWSLVTVLMFISFVGISLMVSLPTKDQPYKDADKLALKDEHDDLINPRYPDSSDKRTKS